MPRVLLLTETHPPDRGGMAESCDRIVRGLRREGVTVDVVHLDRRGATSSTPRPGVALTHGCHLDPAHTINTLWNRMRQQLDLGAVTHVVAFGGSLPIMAAPALAAWMARPLVTLLRGNELDAGLFDPRRRPLLDDALIRSAAVCTVTTEQADKVAGLHPRIRPTVIANGIDFELWRATDGDRMRAAGWREANVEPGRRVLGFFGHLKAKKGVPFFLDVLRRSGEASRFHLLLVGEPDEELQALLDANDFSRTLVPVVDRFDLLPFHLASDLVVLPSHYDGFPNVLIEAMALARPLLASTVGGMRDVLVDGDSAYLFAPGDAHECRRAIHRAATASDELLHAMGIRAAAVASERCDAIVEARRYVQVLDATTREETACATPSHSQHWS